MNRTLLFSCLGLLASFSVSAATLQVEFDLPEFKIENYNKPYVAIWAESKQQNKTLLLWHLKRVKDDKWLPDIRRWWRKVGRYDVPKADGITGATRGPGNYKVTLNTGELEKFKLMIEVVREDGGRTLLKQAIDASKGKQRFKLASGEEVGGIIINLGN